MRVLKGFPKSEEKISTTASCYSVLTGWSLKPEHTGPLKQGSTVILVKICPEVQRREISAWSCELSHRFRDHLDERLLLMQVEVKRQTGLYLRLILNTICVNLQTIDLLLLQAAPLLQHEVMLTRQPGAALGWMDTTGFTELLDTNNNASVGHRTRKLL